MACRSGHVSKSQESHFHLPPHFGPVNSKRVKSRIPFRVFASFSPLSLSLSLSLFPPPTPTDLPTNLETNRPRK